MSDPAGVVVVGGGLSGLAAAARLAALGHGVTVLEESATLGGRWGARPESVSPVLTLPAAWRDAFRKTGKTLDLELAARGLTMVPAPPAIHHFPDGTSLHMPTGRGEQYEMVLDQLGPRAAVAWRDLVDSLDPTWLAVRQLGLEAPLPPRRALRAQRDSLLWSMSVADLARSVPTPLAHIVEATAWRIGSRPTRTPAFVAARLAVERSFGRWHLATTDGSPRPAVDLADLLAARATARGVEICTATSAIGRAPEGVAVPTGSLPASAVVATPHPWHSPPIGLPQKWFAALRPALSPHISRRTTPSAGRGIAEAITHSSDGPRVTFTVVSDGTAEEITHDFARATADPATGARWEGARSWHRRPPVRRPDGWWSATTAAPGGNEPWAQLLSAALAVYDVHESLTGEDVRPANKAYRPRVHRRRRPPAAGPPGQA